MGSNHHSRYSLGKTHIVNCGQPNLGLSSGIAPAHFYNYYLSINLVSK